MNSALLGDKTVSERHSGVQTRRMLVGMIALLMALAGYFAFATSSKAAFVTNPGPVNSEVTGGFLKVGSMIEQSFDSLEEVPTFGGTIDSNGDVVVPENQFQFGELEFPIDTEVALLGRIQGVIGIQVMPTHPVVGNIDPVTGIGNMRIRLRIKAYRLSGSTLLDVGNNCFLGSVASPIDLQLSTETGPTATTEPGLSLGGERYNIATGRARFADKNFAVPSATNCGSLTSTLNGQLGLPSPAGSNGGEFELEFDPKPLSTATINISGRPANPTNQTNANFTFTSNVGSALNYECRLDSGAWAACNGMTAGYTGLNNGSHTFSVRAMAGEIEAGTSSYTWVVDTVAPVITFTGGPTGLTNSRSASFSVSKSKTLSSITCQLDGNPVTPCSTTATFTNNFTNLTDGSHTFTVSGQDAAGNTASTTRNWTVDATKPVVAFTSTPPNPTSTAEVTFEFTATDNMTANPTAQCQVRNMRNNLPAGQIVQAWTNCTSPNPQVRATGKWRFELRATDAAGNVSDTATYDWDANTAEPVIDDLTGPAGQLNSNRGGTRSSDAEFEFKAETFDIDGEVIPGTVFRYECWLDGESLGDCEAPMTLADLTGGTPLDEGHHIFEVKPTLVANPEVPGFRTAYEWYVDTVDPTIAFENTPDAHHDSSTAEFVLNTDGTGSNGTARCKLDNQNWQNCDSNTDHSVDVADGSHTLKVKAIDQAANESAVIEHNWVTDTVDPTASITATPLDNDKSGKAKFDYVTNDDRAGVKVYCQLDNEDAELCGRTQHLYGSVTDGVHTFKLTAVDAAGNEVERTHTWRSDTTAPALNIGAGPEALTTLTNAAFKFASTDEGSGIESVDCRVDGDDWETCNNGSVWNFYPGPYANGNHKFEVRVIDVAQNVSIRDYDWTVSLIKPDVAIATSIGETTSTTASIKFLSSDNGVTFECKLDANSWQTCASPMQYTDLSVGNHVFQVRSVDEVGHRSDEDSMAWTVKTGEPSVCPDGTVGVPPDCVEPPKCPDGQIGTPPNCEEPPVCPVGTTGTPPNCVKNPDAKCEDGFVGTPPNCKQQLPPAKKPTAVVGTLDGNKLSIRLKCPAGLKPKCQGNAVAVTSKAKGAKAMSSIVKNTAKAGKWKVVTLKIKGAYLDQVRAMTAVDSKQLVIKQTIKSKTKKKRVVFHTYKVRAKG